MKTKPQLVTVCDKCLRASCWQGIFPCSDAMGAGTTQLNRRQLRAFNRENECYWKKDREINDVTREPKPTKSTLDKICTSKAQLKLKAKHGTPGEFAIALYKCVPGTLSMYEAAEATDIYLKKWIAAA